MIKVCGWMFMVISTFWTIGFFFDWVDVQKNRDAQRIEVYLNTGKIGSDITTCCDTIVNWF